MSNYVTKLMSTAPEMLKSVSGIDVEALIKGLTKGKTEPKDVVRHTAAPITSVVTRPAPAAPVTPAQPVEPSEHLEG